MADAVLVVADLSVALQHHQRDGWQFAAETMQDVQEPFPRRVSI